jgi:hypothetical protein
MFCRRNPSRPSPIPTSTKETPGAMNDVKDIHGLIKAKLPVLLAWL